MRKAISAAALVVVLALGVGAGAGQAWGAEWTPRNLHGAATLDDFSTNLRRDVSDSPPEVRREYLKSLFFLCFLDAKLHNMDDPFFIPGAQTYYITRMYIKFYDISKAANSFYMTDVINISEILKVQYKNNYSEFKTKHENMIDAEFDKMFSGKNVSNGDRADYTPQEILKGRLDHIEKMAKDLMQ